MEAVLQPPDFKLFGFPIKVVKPPPSDIDFPIKVVKPPPSDIDFDVADKQLEEDKSNSAADKDEEEEKPLMIEEEQIPIRPPFSLHPLFSGALLAAGAPANDVKLTQFIAKQLYSCDVDEDQTRLSMPRSIIKGSILSEDEELLLKQRDDQGKPVKIPVKVIDPSFKVHDLNLKRWNYGDSRPESKQRKKRKTEPKKEVGWKYVISGVEWKKLVQSNLLKQGDNIQVWAFRRVNNELGFVIVNEDKVLDDAVVVVDEDGDYAGIDFSWGRKKGRGSKGGH